MGRPKHPALGARGAGPGGGQHKCCIVTVFTMTILVWLGGLYRFVASTTATPALVVSSPAAQAPLPPQVPTVKKAPGTRGLNAIASANAHATPSLPKMKPNAPPTRHMAAPNTPPDEFKAVASTAPEWVSEEDLVTADGPPGLDNRATELVHCDTSKGPFTVAVHRTWAPLGAERFLDLVRDRFFDTKIALFRAVKNFICQFGVAGDPKVQREWRAKGTIQDDPIWLEPGKKFQKGWMSFAGSGANSRSTQMFVAYANVPLGRSKWEVPFGRVIAGFENVEKWYTGYGELRTFNGNAPDQVKLQNQGLAYAHTFDQLDYINSCRVVWSADGPEDSVRIVPASQDAAIAAPADAAADAVNDDAVVQAAGHAGDAGLIYIEGSGDDEVDRPVPEFWRPPGEVVVPGEPRPRYLDIHDYVDGQPTIFLKLASYRDYQCPTTLDDAIRKAKYPFRLSFGVVEQNAPGDPPCGRPERSCAEDPTQPLCDDKYRARVRVYRMNAQDATGPVTARHLGDRLYRGEHFVLQVDAHSTFAADWDEDIINQWKATNNEMAIMSTYPTDIKGFGGVPVLDENNHSTVKSTPVMCNSQFEPSGIIRHLGQPETMPPEFLNGSPLLQPFWAAGISFSRGHFVVNVPYDCCLWMMFQGEEIDMTVRAFTWGYDNYTPHKSVLFHHYKRKKAPPLFWENSQQHKGEAKLANSRVLEITQLGKPRTQEFSHDELNIYGRGTERPVDWFYWFYGVDRARNEVHEGLCSYARTGTMHQMYTSHMNEGNLGINFQHLVDAAEEEQHKPVEEVINAEIDKAFMKMHPKRARARLDRLRSEGRDVQISKLRGAAPGPNLS
uniref:PPIase cyclophilin-type domain-containing protein n=1 Tax=Phaeomonas parva TaxID=124430 RepID=A0A7S1U7Y9_9STRA|mmetsp:Transcript_35685/g.112132  ORF Transcript_35685/g.112132 Transcript_35685/m.112132 type:complete len:839 (+) Transcript_35685:59-2575(+)|eukprot:CAMPEP_0118884148 /NCGR_PEP_ID=MMETSP1163-20130328/23064_1 /TAXON_ID=124430 /ORGANISM="Phaeomonas parva, Strain CCMP2877" /LENGTH=838 /DNA_ID=CAMNT_0006821831 /DNA_START=146 /DNA_END=2662 /DNA_ORIENTATION=+